MTRCTQPLDFLAALAGFTSLSSLCLHMKTLNDKDAPNYLSRDVKMVTSLARYLFDMKHGCPFVKIEVLLGPYKSLFERPELNFSCHKTKGGELVVEYNHPEADANWFKSYAYMFDGEDIDEWEETMADADRKMACSEEGVDDDGDLASLFGGSASSDAEDGESG